MGFSEGSEDEFLLTCFVCKQPFGMLAAFCGGCGSRRDQAMGVERAKSTQQITQNVIETHSFEETFKEEVTTTEHVPSPFDDYQAPEAVSYSAPEKQPRAAKKKSIKQQIFISNMHLRIDAFNAWQSRRARLLNISGSILFLAASYLFIQGFTVGATNPEAAAETYLKEGVARDPLYFLMNADIPGAKSYPVFPVQFLPKQGATDWFYTSRTKGLLGTAEISITPSGSQYDQTPITIAMKAQYTKVLGIFRTPLWVAANRPATITLDYPSNRNTLIYINGYAAGTVANPAVKAGTYFIYPGVFEVKFYLNGNETNDSFRLNIDTSGSY